MLIFFLTFDTFFQDSLINKNFKSTAFILIIILGLEINTSFLNKCNNLKKLLTDLKLLNSPAAYFMIMFDVR